MSNDKNNLWLDWDINAEELEKINNQDKTAIDNFFNNNYKRFRSLAYSFRRKRELRIELDEMMNSLYIDLYLWGQDKARPIRNGFDIYSLVKRSFYYSQFGGIAYLKENNPSAFAGADRLPLKRNKPLSYDAPLLRGDSKRQDDSDRTLLDLLSAVIPANDDEQENAHNYEICKNACMRYLSKREQQFFDYYLQGLATSKIAENMGCQVYSISTFRKRAFAKLRIHYLDIANYLTANGVELPDYAFCPPEDLDECKRLYERTPEQKRKFNEYQRKRRAMQKLALTQQPYTTTNPLPL